MGQPERLVNRLRQGVCAGDTRKKKEKKKSPRFPQGRRGCAGVERMSREDYGEIRAASAEDEWGRGGMRRTDSEVGGRRPMGGREPRDLGAALVWGNRAPGTGWLGKRGRRAGLVCGSEMRLIQGARRIGRVTGVTVDGVCGEAISWPRAPSLRSHPRLMDWCPVCNRLIEPKKYTVPISPPPRPSPAAPPTSPQSSRSSPSHLLHPPY
jgi:hypothetical protein